MHNSSDQEAQQKRPIQGQEAGTQQIIRPGEGRTRLCSRQGAVEIQEDAIPRVTKARGKISYHVRAGESDSG